MTKSITLSPEDVFATYYSKLPSECSFSVSEHALVYAARGGMDVMTDGNLATVVKEGECVFLRKGSRPTLVNYPSESAGYQLLVVMFFPRRVLFEFYKTMPDEDLPQKPVENRRSVSKIAQSSMMTSLFDSFRPYWLAEERPEKGWLKMKVLEAVRFLSRADESAYGLLFDFTARWRLDIIGFMEKNYMYELTVDELARYTGRSVATFKRDFKKLSDVSPRNWIIRRRLQAAQHLLLTTDRPINQIMSDVGFKNFSHFSRVYREKFGLTPTESRQNGVVANVIIK